MDQPNKCDGCGNVEGTLYDFKNGVLVCLVCTGLDATNRSNVFKLMRRAVSGVENLRRRRNAMERRAA